jgi:hypothetical protein
VVPISAAIATERAKGAVTAVKDDMEVPFLDFGKLVISPFDACERLNGNLVEFITSVIPRKILM